MVDPEFRKKRSLSSSSNPHKSVCVFLSLHKPRGNGLFLTEKVKNIPGFQGDFQTHAIWTNIRAKLKRTDPNDNYYPDS